MNREDAMLILGLDENYTEEELWKSYSKVWNSIEIQRYFASPEDSKQIEETLGRLNEARNRLSRE